MFNSVVLDVVIGLLFIYLLYSLLATILSEIVATALNLRARNLKEAIDRMLNDDKYRYWIGRLWDSIYLLNSPRNPVVNAFYEHPEIKYQGSSGVYKRPSNFKAGSFSKTIIALLAGKDPLDRQTLEEKLKNATISLDPVKEIEESPNRRNSKKFFKKVKLIINWLFDQKRSSLELEPNEISDAVKRKINEIYTGFNKDWEKVKPELEKYLKESVEEPKAIKIGTETSKYLRSLWQESQGDIEKFKLLLEDWFEKTMVHTLEWYKRKIRFVTFVLGFLIAWFFNADTFVIVKTISVDKDARDKLVTMATTYVQNNQFAKDTAKVRSAKELEDYNARLDSLMAIRDQIQSDIAKANNILGFGSWPPDTVSVTINPKLKTKIFSPLLNERSFPASVASRLTKELQTKSISANNRPYTVKVGFSLREKWCYFFRLFCHHFWGFLVTALAISLGAPFWFDLLNKIMKLRTSTKEDIKNPDEPASSATVSPLNRVG